MRYLEVGQHLVVDPRTCHGRLTFKGTRVPVATILNRLASGRTIESLRKSWPEVSPEAIEEAVLLATASLIEQCALKAEAKDEPAASGRRTG